MSAYTDPLFVAVELAYRQERLGQAATLHRVTRARPRARLKDRARARWPRLFGVPASPSTAGRRRPAAA